MTLPILPASTNVFGMRPQLESHNKCDDKTRLQQPRQGRERTQEGRLEIPVKHNETLWERAQKDVLQLLCFVYIYV